MTKDYAFVDAGVVSNVAVASDPPDENWFASVTKEHDVVVELTGVGPRPGIGWSYVDGVFTPPPEPMPPEP